MPAATSTGTTQTSSQTSPWAPQAAALTSAFTNAGTAYGTSSGAESSLPTNFTASMTPQQLAIYQQMAGAGTGAAPAATSETNAGVGETNAGATGAEGALTSLGAFNPTTANNPTAINNAAEQYVAGQNIPSQVQQAMVGANQEANEVTLPGINQNMTNTGNQNSSRSGIADGLVQQGLAENAQNMTNSDEGQAYTTGLNLAENQATSNNTDSMSALAAALSGGNSLASTGAGTTSSGIQDLINSLGMGEVGASGAQTNAQEGDTNALQSYEANTQAPYTSLQDLMSIIGGTNWGSTSSGTQATTSTPSALSIIGGGLGALGSLTGSTGVVGGANAGLGSSGILGLLSALGPL